MVSDRAVAGGAFAEIAFADEAAAEADPLASEKATGAAEAAEAAAEADPSASEKKAAGAAEAEAPARCSNSWLRTVSNMKFEPVTCVHGRRLCTRLTASHGSNLYAIMAYAAVHVPAQWAPARQWIRTFSLRKSELLTKRYNCSKAGNTGRVSGATPRHQCGASTRPCHSGAGMLAETLATNPHGDLVEEREVIGARVAALIDARFPALRVLREDQINCAVTRGVEGPPVT